MPNKGYVLNKVFCNIMTVTVHYETLVYIFVVYLYSTSLAVLTHPRIGIEESYEDLEEHTQPSMIPGYSIYKEN